MTTRSLQTDYEHSVHAQFLNTAGRYGSAEFLCVPLSACKSYADTGFSYTYSGAAAIVERWKAIYQAANVGPGHRVALLLENRPDFFFHWLAVNAVGASVVPLNPDYRRAELNYVLHHSEASLAVVLSRRLADVADAAGDIQVVCVDEAHERIEPLPIKRGESGRSAECALLYTSGTTGKPKGCILSNDYYLRSGLRYINRRGYVELEHGASRVITPLPMFHINAMAASTLGVIFAGGCIVQLDRFHPSTWWEDVAQTRATGAHCLGVMPAMLLGMPPGPFDRAHGLKYCTAANVEPQHHAAFEERFGVPLVEGWSMTETGAGAAISADTEPRHIGSRCFGRVPANMELRLVDQQGSDVPPGEAGEMLVRAKGPDPRLGFFSGYLKDDAATQAGWEGGWWHTGDIARCGPDGSMYFVDRKKSLIRRSGENISALEVEVSLREHALVREAAITGVPDAVRGEEVFAFVVLAERQPAPQEGASQAASQAAAQILTWLASQLAYYKVPGYVAFVPQLPLTSSQKIERGTLKQLARAHVEAGTCIDAREQKAALRQRA